MPKSFQKAHFPLFKIEQLIIEPLSEMIRRTEVRQALQQEEEAWVQSTSERLRDGPFPIHIILEIGGEKTWTASLEEALWVLLGQFRGITEHARARSLADITCSLSWVTSHLRVRLSNYELDVLFARGDGPPPSYMLRRKESRVNIYWERGTLILV